MVSSFTEHIQQADLAPPRTAPQLSTYVLYRELEKLFREAIATHQYGGNLQTVIYRVPPLS